MILKALILQAFLKYELYNLLKIIIITYIIM